MPENRRPVSDAYIAAAISAVDVAGHELVVDAGDPAQQADDQPRAGDVAERGDLEGDQRQAEHVVRQQRQRCEDDGQRRRVQEREEPARAAVVDRLALEDVAAGEPVGARVVGRPHADGVAPDDRPDPEDRAAHREPGRLAAGTDARCRPPCGASDRGPPSRPDRRCPVDRSPVPSAVARGSPDADHGRIRRGIRPYDRVTSGAGRVP